MDEKKYLKNKNTKNVKQPFYWTYNKKTEFWINWIMFCCRIHLKRLGMRTNQDFSHKIVLLLGVESFEIGIGSELRDKTREIRWLVVLSIISRIFKILANIMTVDKTAYSYIFTFAIRATQWRSVDNWNDSKTKSWALA